MNDQLIRKKTANRTLRWGAFLLGLLMLCAVLADFLSPYDPAEQHRELYFAPPARIRFPNAESSWRPFVYALRLEDLERMRYVEDNAQR